MQDRSTSATPSPVPPGSTANRELFHVIAQALDVPPPATVRDELTYFRCVRDRARVVLATMARLSSDREADDLDIMAAAVSIREQLSDFPCDGYDHAVSGSGSSC